MGSCNNNIKNATSAGESGGCVYASANGYPWIGDGNNGDYGILYGFVAGPNDPSCNQGGGACYAFEIENTNGEDDITANVQITNCGGDVGGTGCDCDPQYNENCQDTRSHIFDFMVPGGGFGKFDACDGMPGWKVSPTCSANADTNKCAQYGGLYNSTDCNTVFPDDTNALNACKDVLFNPNVFPTQANIFPGNPTIKNIRKIDCPQFLINKSGMNGGPGIDDAVVKANGSNEACITHYWDCAKPNAAWDKSPNATGDMCPNGSMTAIIVDDNGNQVSTLPDSCGGDSTPIAGAWDNTPCCSWSPYVECGTTTGYCASQSNCENVCGGKWYS